MSYTPFLAGQKITADLLNTRIIQVTMDWTPLTSLGSYQGGAADGTPVARMRKFLFMGTEVWEFEGRVTIPTLAGGSSLAWFQFSATPFISGERGFFCYGFGSTYAHRVGFVSSGQCRVQTPAGSTGSSTGFLLDGCYVTNPV